MWMLFRPKARTAMPTQFGVASGVKPKRLNESTLTWTTSASRRCSRPCKLGISFDANPVKCCVTDIDTTKERLIVFSDASFGRDIHPFAGGFVQYRNGPLAWIARKAKFVPLSSCEIEVFAVVMLLKEAEFASQVIEFLNTPLDQKVASITDNKSARDVIKCPGATKRTVHFDRWLHFAREHVLMNKAEIFFTPTEDMMADGFTKALDKTKFLKCRDYMMSSW